MCENCFNHEIDAFPDEKSWASFDLELTKKLAQGKMKHAQFIHDGKLDKNNGYYIYECLTCGEKWKMKDPDNAFRGYFLRLSTVNKIGIRLTAGQKIGLVILGLVVIRILYGVFTSLF